MDERGARLKQLIATGQQKGCVLFADIDVLLPQDYGHFEYRWERKARAAHPPVAVIP